jgi:hypothetical protein
MSGWRLFFIVAAIFNFAAGLPLLIAPDAMGATLGLPMPDDLLIHRLAGLLIACFGGLYAYVAQDLERYRPLMWLGVVGKAGVFVLFTQAWFAGTVPLPAYVVAFGDLAFGVGFLVFLLTPAKRAA